MAALEIELFTARSDNFAVLIHDPETGETAAIDAPEEKPIRDALERRGWSLTHILITHKHGDHVEGNEALKSRYGAKIIGSEKEARQIPGIDETVKEGDRFTFAGRPVEVIETPGHTAGHICYHLPEDKLLFAADTLFALGCGRLFEGSAAEMWASLKKLKALPDDTAVYFGHEYTLTNARFSLTVDPENTRLVERCDEIEKRRAANHPTAPTTIGLEKATNPFLRPNDPGIRRALAMENASDEDVFAEIRRRKDSF